MMRSLAFLILCLPCQVLGIAPECPGYSTRQDCLNSVDDNYKRFLEFIEEDDFMDTMILVANDIRYYEGLACQKTCIN